MIKFKREMKKAETIKIEHPCWQASFNSDGRLTLRGYNIYNQDNDEIILFSQSETRAVIELFREIADKIKSVDMPF